MREETYWKCSPFSQLIYRTNRSYSSIVSRLRQGTSTLRVLRTKRSSLEKVVLTHDMLCLSSADVRVLLHRARVKSISMPSLKIAANAVNIPYPAVSDHDKPTAYVPVELYPRYVDIHVRVDEE